MRQIALIDRDEAARQRDAVEQPGVVAGQRLRRIKHQQGNIGVGNRRAAARDAEAFDQVTGLAYPRRIN